MRLTAKPAVTNEMVVAVIARAALALDDEPARQQGIDTLFSREEAYQPLITIVRGCVAFRDKLTAHAERLGRHVPPVQDSGVLKLGKVILGQFHDGKIIA